MAKGGKRPGAGRPRTTQSDSRAFLRSLFEADDKAGLRRLWDASVELADGVQVSKVGSDGQERVFRVVPDPSHLHRLFEAAYGRAPQTTDLTVSGAVQLVPVATGFDAPIVPDAQDERGD